MKFCLHFTAIEKTNLLNPHVEELYVQQYSQLLYVVSSIDIRASKPVVNFYKNLFEPKLTTLPESKFSCSGEQVLQFLLCIEIKEGTKENYMNKITWSLDGDHVLISEVC